MRAAIALVMLASAAHANSPEPSRATLAAVAATCTEKGAFGAHFGESDHQPGGIAPFVIEPSSNANAITAAASFARAPMSAEDRDFLAAWVFRKLASAIAARKFAHRQDRRDGITFTAETYTLDLSRDGTTVRLTCTARKP